MGSQFYIPSIYDEEPCPWKLQFILIPDNCKPCETNCGHQSWTGVSLVSSVTGHCTAHNVHTPAPALILNTGLFHNSSLSPVKSFPLTSSVSVPCEKYCQQPEMKLFSGELMLLCANVFVQLHPPPPPTNKHAYIYVVHLSKYSGTVVKTLKLCNN